MNGPVVSRFVIPAPEAELMAQRSGLSLLSLLPTLVQSSRPLARPPVSNYQVAAVGLCSDGRIFVGVNLEFPGAPLHHSVHAEQFLVTNLAVHGGGGLLALAVSSAPCGNCRQFLQELRSAADLKICITSDQSTEFRPLISILPSPFGPFDLLNSQMPLLLEPNHNRLCVGRTTGPACNSDHNGSVTVAVRNGNSCSGHRELNNHPVKGESQLETRALEAANCSHAPYSNCPSGVALMDCEGKIYKGSYMESAAHSPSLGPVQAAVVAFVAAGGGGYDRIVSGVLAEREGSVVRQEDTARLLLKLISPTCDLRVIHCRSI